MRKLIFLIGGLLSSWAITAQTLTEADAAILFSKHDLNGTARFNSMGGAFGAVGGDYSAMDINPAGIAIFKNSGLSASLGVRDTDIESSFYGTNTIPRFNSDIQKRYRHTIRELEELNKFNDIKTAEVYLRMGDTGEIHNKVAEIYLNILSELTDSAKQELNPNLLSSIRGCYKTKDLNCLNRKSKALFHDLVSMDKQIF